jgi:hypothetical protein
LFDVTTLIGVIMFSTPISETARSIVFGPENKSRVIELHRMHIKWSAPKNTESWFISRALKLLKEDRPDIWAVITYADTTYGHTGGIYKATNAYSAGMSASSLKYVDRYGRLHSARQNGKNITREEARAKGWTPKYTGKKYRYVYLLPDSKQHKKELLELCTICGGDHERKV